MIKIDERYSITSDRHNWIVIETYEGKGKDGLPKPQTREHFFPNLAQCIAWCVKNDAKQSVTLLEILLALEGVDKYCDGFSKGLEVKRSEVK